MKKDRENVLLFLEKISSSWDDKTALGIKSYIGWREYTYKGTSILSMRLGAYLIKQGLQKGDRISIISESKPEWAAAFFGSLLAGATIVPIDIKLTEYEMLSILSDCTPKFMFVSGKYINKAVQLKEKLPGLKEIILIDELFLDNGFTSIYNLPDAKGVKWRHRGYNTTAMIIYTSGTTGKPKGVEMSFKNVMAQVKAIGKCFMLGPEDRLLSILPMNHLFELSVGFLTFLSKGVSIYYPKSLNPKDVFPILQEKKITFMVLVPAFLKLLKSTIEAEINQYGKFEKFKFNLLYKLASMVPSYKFRKFLFPKIHAKFGGQFKGCISGGAPLDMEVARFIENLGIKIYEGYGLSEAAPVVSVNTDKASRLGSVGKALPGVKVKIDEETGELLVSGDNVMKGYHHQPELTAETIDPDGWLHTGDIAEIDKDGFIFITGRIKNMIVLNGGKKVFPEEVEAVLEQSPMFSEVCVLGVKRVGGQKNGTEDIAAVVVPTEQVINAAPDDETLEKQVRAEVKNLSQRLSIFKRPTYTYVFKEPLERTATSKIKRKVLAEKIAQMKSAK